MSADAAATPPGPMPIAGPDQARLLERVRKLLAKAEHPKTPAPEAEALSEKAAELMGRYALDQALLASGGGGREAPELRVIDVASPYAMPKAVLLSTVATTARVRTVVGGLPGGGRRCTLVGFPADLAAVEVLFTSLLLQAGSAMLAASRGRPRVRAYRHAFLLGYASAIGRRLRAAHERAQQQAEREAAPGQPGVALVLADRAREVERAFAAQFPSLRQARVSVSDGGGLAAGHAAGERADLSTRQRHMGAGPRALG